MSRHRPCLEKHKKTLHRLHRIQGQLSALERDIQDERECEYLLIQATAIEKAIVSLILHLMEGHLDDQVTAMLRDEPERAVQDVKRLFELVTR